MQRLTIGTMQARSARMMGQGKEIWTRFCEIAALPFSRVGRKRLWPSIWYRLWPALFPLAGLYRRTLIRRTRVIAVIGSLGKTTATRAITAVLGLPVSRVKGWNAGGFLAGALFRIRPGDCVAVIEVGTKFKGRMLRYRRLLKPDLVVVTAIATEHHRTLGTIAEIRTEKAEMLRHLPETGLVILNGDDPNALWMKDQTQASVLTFGFAEPNNIRASSYRPEGVAGGQFLLHVGDQSCRVRTKLVGQHMVYALLASIAVAHAEGVEIKEAIQAIEDLPPTRHRLQPLELTNGVRLLMDDFKAVYETIEPALDTLVKIPAATRVAVLGEIFEPPGNEKAIYQSLGRRVAQTVDRVIFLGGAGNYENLSNGATQEGMASSQIHHATQSVYQAALLVKEQLGSRDVVLVKGIGSLRLERIPLILAGEEVDCRLQTCRVPMALACADCPLLRSSSQAGGRQ
ncbi:Mur ligase family protein [Candidatus Bipolaricaulota bacterium]